MPITVRKAKPVPAQLAFGREKWLEILFTISGEISIETTMYGPAGVHQSKFHQ